MLTSDFIHTIFASLLKYEGMTILDRLVKPYSFRRILCSEGYFLEIFSDHVYIVYDDMGLELVRYLTQRDDGTRTSRRR